MRLFGLCFTILTLLAGSIALAADADDGKRLAEIDLALADEIEVCVGEYPYHDVWNS